MAQWLAMGGYAVYVWPAYAVFFAVLAWDWFAPALRRRRLSRELRGRIARERIRNTRAARAEAST
ncbi:MAG TPA: heme exporter protein CcmD [Rhodanobacteraceae bacterium]|jgi:heme exporter protein D|nr:heme exporter protein CcmD [Rhodanobacteraceae bacterium]